MYYVLFGCGGLGIELEAWEEKIIDHSPVASVTSALSQLAPAPKHRPAEHPKNTTFEPRWGTVSTLDSDPADSLYALGAADSSGQGGGNVPGNGQGNQGDSKGDPSLMTHSAFSFDPTSSDLAADLLFYVTGGDDKTASKPTLHKPTSLHPSNDPNKVNVEFGWVLSQAQLNEGSENSKSELGGGEGQKENDDRAMAGGQGVQGILEHFVNPDLMAGQWLEQVKKTFKKDFFFLSLSLTLTHTL